MAGQTTILEATPLPAPTERQGPAVGPPAESAAVVEARGVAHEAQNLVASEGSEAALGGIVTAGPPRIDQFPKSLPAEKGPTGLPQEPENRGIQNATDGVNSETDEDRWNRRYENMDPDRLDAKRNSLSRRIENRQNRLERRVLTTEQEGALEAEIERLEAELEVIDSIQDEKKGDSFRDRGERRMTREERQDARDEARREARARQDEYRRLARLSSDELNTEAQTEEAVLRATRRELEGSRSGADGEEINKRIRDSEARVEALNNLRESRKPEEQKKETEAEAEEAKKQEEERVRWMIESASLPQLEGWIGKSTQQLTALETRINQLQEAAIYGKNKEAVQKELNEKVAESNEVRRRLGMYQEALANARGREAVEKGLEQVLGIESVRRMSANEFRGLSVEEKAKYLAELREFTNMPDDIQFAALKEIAKNGGAMSIEQRATFAKRLGQELLKKGVKGYGMENVVRLMKQYPDIAKVAFDEITADKAIRERLDQLPEELKKGKGGKNLLWLLLMIIGSVVFSSVSSMKQGVQESVGLKT